MTDLVLSIFPGIDLLGKAFEELGFCVVRGPDPIFGGDIRSFHPPAGVWSGVVGGPPCQVFSRMRHINPKCGEATGDLIPEFERAVFEAQPAWFLMENIIEAPVPLVEGYQSRPVLVRDVWVGGETQRLRRFTFGTRDGRPLQVDELALHSADPLPAALAGGSRRVPVAINGGGKGKVKSTRRVCAGDDKTLVGLAAAIRAQGLPDGFLDTAPFTVAGKIKAIGNGVPLPMGRAVAQAVRRALSSPTPLGGQT